MTPNPLADLEKLGGYLREQRQSARLTLRQLSERAGVSNPYLSQLERGLKRPSAEILNQIAKGLQISAESLYVQAGILDEDALNDAQAPSVRVAIAADHHLTARQKATLIEVYESFVEEEAPSVAAPAAKDVTPSAPTPTTPTTPTTTH